MIDAAHGGELADGGHGYEGHGCEVYGGEVCAAGPDAVPDGAGAAGTAGSSGVGSSGVDTAGELPDLLGLDLAALRTLDHPVLAEVMADLRGRAAQPREMLWGFNNAF
ncbi:FxSxx-COOH cyclophane-containing RiPP peptide [Streptomyces sp. NPDC059092]|uniref:FxSxx-COOH cyclophane-containing RiPP peptide n=1 Tax=Streptomyces sp. NPDC059092 TaxID=3346725 RepID=UPI0036A76356